MATTVHEPPKIDPERLPSQGSGNGGWRNLVPASGDLRRRQGLPSSGEHWHLGRLGGHHHELCRLHQCFDRSSGSCARLAALHFATRSVPQHSGDRGQQHHSGAGAPPHCGIHGRPKGKDHSAPPAQWLYITLFLGLLFVAGQTFAWMQLKSQGFGLATNISYSFFYVLTVAHALHVFGGLGGLVRVITKLNKSSLRRSTLDATSRYWHFMGVLWVYLLLLLWMKL